MRTTTVRRLALWVIATAFVASAAPQPAAAQLAKTDQKCREAVAKAFSKAVNAANKASTVCHKGRNVGKIVEATDCNDLAQADTKQKFQKAQTKLADAIAKLCTAAGASNAVLDEFVSCPEPCATETGVTNPLSSFADVGQCLSCLAGDVVERRNADMLGSPTAPLPKTELKCHGAIAKGYAKRLKTLLKSRTGCQKAQDALGNLSLQPCDTSDDGGKIAAATVKADDLISSACATANLAALDSCSAASLNDLQVCLLAEDDAAAAEAFPAHYELSATTCPVSVTVTTHAGTGVGGTSGTRFDAGWNGVGHGQDLVDLFSYGLALSCPNSEPPCGTCAVTGFTDTGVQSGAFTRCRENTSQECSNPFGTDPACPGLQECATYLGPPLPLSAGNNPVCVVVRADTDATGSAVVETGDTAIGLDLRAVVHLGLSLTRPCPICVGDTTPQDGVADGTCTGGTRNGLACDTQGFDATFGNLSLDCPPDTGANVSGAGLVIDTTLDTGTSSMPFNLACDFPLNGFDCACAVCSGDASIPCNADADCAMLGLGTCTSTGGGTTRAPNSCADLTCTSIGGDQGECMAGPDNRYCDQQVRANSKGYIGCLSNADCDAVASACDGNDCGDCELIEPTSCFLDPIVADGTPDPDQPIVATTFCIPPTSSSGVNAATGLPGPSRAYAEVETQYNF